MCRKGGGERPKGPKAQRPIGFIYARKERFLSQRQEEDKKPDLKDVCHYVDAKRLDHHQMSTMGRTQKIAEMRSKLMLLSQKDFDLAMEALSKLIDGGAAIKQPENPAIAKKQEESLTLYEESRPMSSSELDVQGVRAV